MENTLKKPMTGIIPPLVTPLLVWGTERNVY